MDTTIPKILLEICGACQPQEKILFVTDKHLAPIAKRMFDATPEYPNRRIVTIEKERNMHGQDPESAIAEAMYQSDVIYGITKYSLFHTKARRDAVANGARYVNMVDYNMQMLEPGSSIDCDFIGIGETCTRIANALTDRKTCRITTKRGTDFSCSIEGIAPTPQYGRSVKPGQGSSPPDIECATCAVEGTGNGVVYIDGSIPHPELGLIHDEIKLTIKNGIVIDISGGPQAEILARLFRSFNDPAVYIVGEIGIGLNPKCTLSGSMLEDEGALGTVHIATGSSTTFGGKTTSPYHMDLVFRDPTISIDSLVILKDGVVAI